MGRRRKLNIGHRMSKDSNQHVQGSGKEGTESIHTTSTHESADPYSIPSDIEAEEAHIEKDVEPKRLRGPTRMLDVWEMEGGDVIIVNLDKCGRPIGPEGTSLTRFIGSMARRHQFASLKYKSWKDMPDKEKKSMLAVIESKYEFVPPINDATREMLKSELNDKWKQWKCDLKSMTYDPSKTEEEVASKVPDDDRIDASQYRELVHYWYSDEGQKVSKINSQNRSKYEDVHCMGTKSFPKLIDEKKKKSKGVSPERKEIYIDSRTRKDGSIVNEKAARLIEELNKHRNQVGTSQLAPNTQSHVSWNDDIFSQVQGPGKRGRVRCVGKIPKSKISKASFSENQELRNELKQMRENHKQMQEKQERTNTIMANMMTWIQNRFSGEDVNAMIQAARQVSDASSASRQTNSLGPDINEDDYANEQERLEANFVLME